MANNDVKKVFGTSIRGLRTQMAISQEELAERADLHRTYISDVERGSRNISLENIEKLAAALGVSVAALFPLGGPPSEAGKIMGKSGVPSKNLVEVLLVEDTPDDVELTLNAFKMARLSNHVHVVEDGAAALNFIFCRGKFADRRSREHPHVILLDLNLPKVSGLEVLSRLKGDKRTRHIPVVILTISENSNEIAECQRLGAESYIVKPVNFLRLSQATPRLNFDWALFKPSGTKRRNPWVQNF